MGEFAKKVLIVVSKIPRGKTLTHKEVAKRVGVPRLPTGGQARIVRSEIY